MTRVLGALSANALSLGVAAAAFALAAGVPAGHPDMWWHLTSGRWMVEHRDGLRVDVFSSTATGEPYALGQWLGDIALYLAYAAGSWTGIAILRASLVALASFAVTRLALRHAPARVAIPVAVLATLLSMPMWADRPQLFTLALFPLLLELCLAGRAGSRGALVATAPLVAVWANLDPGYALGVALLFVFAFEAMLERRPVTGPLTAAVVAAVVASLEPGALSLLRAISHVAGSTVRTVEGSPVDPLTPFGALFALFVAATIAAFMLRGGSLLGVLVLVPMLWLALSAQRHIPLFGVAVVPFLAGPISGVVDEIGTTLRMRVARTSLSAEHIAGRDAHMPGQARVSLPRTPGELHQIDADLHQIDAKHRASLNESGGPGATPGPPRRPSKSYLPPRLALALAGALWLGALASTATASHGPDLRAYPIRAVDALSTSSGILLNEHDWGGYLIWAVPSRPVFVDGRLYPFAGNGVIRSYQEATSVLPSWRAVIDRWSVAQALLRPDRALVQALRDEGWTVRSQDEGFVLLERPR